MDREQIPKMWEGHRVEADMIRSGGQNNLGGEFPLYGQTVTGFLESVNEQGMVASLRLDGEDVGPVRAFYPWSAVLSLQSLE